MTTYTERSEVPYIPFALVSLPAALVTAALVLMMESLIATDMVPPDEKPIRIAEIVVPDPDPIEFTPDNLVTRPDNAVPPPQWTAPVNSLTPDSDPGDGYAPPPVPSGGLDIVVGKGSGGVVAYLKSQPIYPSRALARGIEGYVDLSFDISASGATANIQVVHSEPEGVFERAAISALKKWKYKVPVIDDEPQPQVDMMTRMTFAIED